MMHNPIFTGVHSSPKETQLQKCCASFGKECSGVGNAITDLARDLGSGPPDQKTDHL